MVSYKKSSFLQNVIPSNAHEKQNKKCCCFEETAKLKRSGTSASLVGNLSSQGAHFLETGTRDLIGACDVYQVSIWADLASNPVFLLIAIYLLQAVLNLIYT